MFLKVETTAGESNGKMGSMSVVVLRAKSAEFKRLAQTMIQLADAREHDVLRLDMPFVSLCFEKEPTLLIAANQALVMPVMP